MPDITETYKLNVYEPIYIFADYDSNISETDNISAESFSATTTSYIINSIENENQIYTLTAYDILNFKYDVDASLYVKVQAELTLTAFVKKDLEYTNITVNPKIDTYAFILPMDNTPLYID